MSELTKEKATICIVNYKTLVLTKLCLRSIRKYTNYPHEVIVIDNDSQDESLDYLNSLGWIRLIERKGKQTESGGYAHGDALNLALENCNTEFFVSMHSDSIVGQENWLTDLVGYLGNDENIACIGSGKIHLPPIWHHFLKKAFTLRAYKHLLLKAFDTSGVYRYWNRTIYSIYRSGILHNENLKFRMGPE